MFKPDLDDPAIKTIMQTTEPIGFEDDSYLPNADGQRPASVLIPLVKRQQDWNVLFTLRPEHMPTHPGQISFPGGRTEAGESPRAGALREVEEEIGIKAKDVELIGRLPAFDAVSNYRVTPFIGILNPKAQIIPCADEVEDVFELPFSFFIDPKNHVTMVRPYKGRGHTMYDMPWPSADTVKHNVWGMTAMMLYQIYQRGFVSDKLDL